jgi:predicted acyl esterase
MVHVQSSWFPLVDLNPQKFTNIYSAKAEDFQKSKIKIFHSARFPSGIKYMELKK